MHGINRVRRQLFALVRLPIPHLEAVRHHPAARFERFLQQGAEAEIDVISHIKHNHRGIRNIFGLEFENIPLADDHTVRHAGGLGVLAGLLDALRINVNAHAFLGLIFLNSRDDDHAIAAAQVVHHILGPHLGNLTHGLYHVIRCGDIADLDMIRIFRVFFTQVHDHGFAWLGRDLARAVSPGVVVGNLHPHDHIGLFRRQFDKPLAALSFVGDVIHQDAPVLARLRQQDLERHGRADDVCPRGIAERLVHTGLGSRHQVFLRHLGSFALFCGRRSRRRCRRRRGAVLGSGLFPGTAHIEQQSQQTTAEQETETTGHVTPLGCEISPLASSHKKDSTRKGGWLTGAAPGPGRFSGSTRAACYNALRESTGRTWRGPMTLLYRDRFFQEHRTGNHPERPERLQALDRRLEQEGLAARCRPGSFRPLTAAAVQQVHAAEQVALVRELAQQGGGWIDADTVVSPASYEVALAAAGACVAAVAAVLQGEDRTALCLVRPPGHHATSRQSMGFCLFNNVALAAVHARQQVERVLIVDWDVHHGNGTQEIFYEDPSVTFYSIHRYGQGFYPGTGSAAETGRGPGLGYTFNAPIPYGTPRRTYLDRFRQVLEQAAARSRPELVLLSAGFDAHRQDPIGSLGLEEEDFREMSRLVLEVARVHAGGRLVSCLEGGYDLEALAACVAVHLQELLAAG
jgi:acetoin utilization deacetylase AcuC-like enzyme